MQPSEWVSFVVPSHQSPVEALREWFYGPPTERARNVAVRDWSHVRCVHLYPDVYVHRFVLDEEDLYTTPYYLFYSFRPMSRMLSVWGSIMWHVMNALGGVVDVRLNVLWERHFECYGEQAIDPPKEPVNHIWLPMNLPRDPQREAPPTEWQNVLRCYQQMVAGDTTAAVVDNGTVTQMLIMAGRVEAYMASQTVTSPVQRLHTSRTTYAQAWMRHALQLSCATEANALRLLIDNGLEPYMDDGMVCMASPRDRQRFYHVWPSQCPPKYVFRVPMEEVPHAALNPFDMHPFGLYHVTYKDLPAWLWTVYCMQNTLLASEPLAAAHQDAQLAELIAWTRDYYATHQSVHRAHVPITSDGGCGGGRRVANADHKVFNVPVEAMASILPPCLQPVALATDFILDGQRRHFLASLREGYVSAESVFNWFETMYATYPDTRTTTAKQRWDYEYSWNRGYPPPTCKMIVTDTLVRKEGVFACPFATPGDTPSSDADMEDYVGDCKRRCVAGGVPITGPYNMIRRALYRNKAFIAVSASAAVAAPVAAQSVVERGSAK